MSTPISWKKTVLDREFRSEGCAVADVNGDGRLDVLAGEFWYEAPDWTPHALRPPGSYDPAAGYSNSFLNWAADVDGDGRPDQIVVGFPGKPAVWRRNPGGPGLWEECVIWPSACNESPAFADLHGDGRPVLIFAHDDRQMAWYAPGADPTALFQANLIGEPGAPGTHRYAHGLGVGDLHGAGRPEELTTRGFWRPPAIGGGEPSGPWTFASLDLGPDCAQMLVHDVDGDGVPDLLTSSAHGKGVWWWQGRRGPDRPRFTQHLVDDTFSQTHALVAADINGDGVTDFVTGKRFWAHGPTGDVDPDASAVLVWYEPRTRGGDVTWACHVIDDDSGVGTQFVVADVNGDGRADIITANKKGIFLFEQG